MIEIIMEEEADKIIRSFKDLIVFKNTYEAMLKVMKELIPFLPESEKYDLKSQLSRSCNAIPRLIAEGYAKRHQKAGFQTYIDDAMGECNETIVSIEQVKDIYEIKVSVCNELIQVYDISGRQLYRLGESWQNVKLKKEC
jgi:four helix bundle protein